MSTGWIKVHRSLVEHDLWLSEPFTRAQAWVDLLMLANHQVGHIRRRGIKVTVKRGQVGYSQEGLALRWRWSKGKVIRFLAELREDNRISQETELKNVAVTALISITNYDQYQGNSTEDKTEDGTVNGPKTEPKTEPKTVLEQECKEVKKERSKPSSDIESFFEELWQAYPRKDGKKEALRHYKASVKTEADMDRINDALGNYLESVVDKELQYIKTGKVWFNNWQDWELKEDADAA